MDNSKSSKWRSRKWWSMWIVEVVLTIFVIIGLYHHADSADGWVKIMDIWVSFTVINVLGYFTANVVRHGQREGWTVSVKNEASDGN